MDVHRHLRDKVANRQQRDTALAWLRQRYAKAIEGTGWEGLFARLRQKTAELEEGLNRDDALELYEIEGRAVGVVWPESGRGRAWVWSGGRWVEAPGLVNKSWLEGVRMSPPVFAREFPGAQLSGLETVAKVALGHSYLDRSYVLTPPSPEIADKHLIDAGYYLTKLFLAQQPRGFETIAADVSDALGLDVYVLLPFLPEWYNFARQELGLREGTDSSTRVDDIVRELVNRDLSGDTSEEADSVGEFLWALPKAVRDFADEKCGLLAKKVRYRLRRMPASGIFDRGDHRNVWDEYCLQVQHGPDQLEGALTTTVYPLIDQVVERLPQDEAVLVSMAQRWESELKDPPFDAIYHDAVRARVLRALRELADEKQQDWVTG